MALGNLTDQYKSIWHGGSYVVMWFQAGDGNMRPGMVCSDDDADEVKVCAIDGTPFGIVNELATADLDTAITAGLAMEVFPIGQGAKLSVAHDTQTQNSAKGGLVIRSATTAGTIENGTTAGVVVGMALELIAAADKFVMLLV